MPIAIYQGHHHSLAPADINIVIDVIRAFTVAHYAFIGGAKEILLVRTADEAFALKDTYPDYVLTGEEKGVGISGFDLDNSPKRMAGQNMTDKSQLDVISGRQLSCCFFSDRQRNRQAPRQAVCQPHLFHNGMIIFFSQKTC